jgi:hypothetical protein
VPFEYIESVLLVGNIAMYIILTTLFLVATSQNESFGVLFMAIGIIFLVVFMALAYFSRGLVRLISSSPVQGKKVSSRLTPLCIISCVATFLSGAYFFVLSTELLTVGITAFYTFDGDFAGPFLVSFFVELGPCCSFLYLLAISKQNKRQSGVESTENSTIVDGVIDYGAQGMSALSMRNRPSSRDESKESLIPKLQENDRVLLSARVIPSTDIEGILV